MLGAFALRPAVAPSAIRDLFVNDATRAAVIATENRAQHTRAAAQARAAAAQAAARRSRLWSTLDAADLRTLITRLRAAGFPPVVIRAVISSRLESSFAARMSELVGSIDAPFWKPEPFSSYGNTRFYETQSQIYRDRAKALREILGDDYFAGSAGEATAEQRRKFGDLPKARIELIQRIVDDYAEMASQVRASTQGIILPEDREKLALLEREKRTDLAAILSPAELEDYEMRNSPLLIRSRTALTLMDATEEEFRAIYRTQQPFADILIPAVFSAYTADIGRLRNEAQQKIADQLRITLGETRYADYARANNYEYQGLHRLAQRENIPIDAINRAYDLRATTAQESMRIHESNLSPADRSAALQALVVTTKNKLTATLGLAAAESFVKSASWLAGIERGYAIKFGGDGTSATYYSPPTPSPAPKE